MNVRIDEIEYSIYHGVLIAAKGASEDKLRICEIKKREKMLKIKN